MRLESGCVSILGLQPIRGFASRGMTVDGTGLLIDARKAKSCTQDCRTAVCISRRVVDISCRDEERGGRLAGLSQGAGRREGGTELGQNRKHKREVTSTDELVEPPEHVGDSRESLEVL